MPTAMEIAFAKAASRKAKEPNTDWSDPKAVEALVKKYPTPKGKMPSKEVMDYLTFQQMPNSKVAHRVSDEDFAKMNPDVVARLESDRTSKK